MRNTLLAGALLTLAIAPPASGQSIVIGGGLAKECYEEVEAGTNRLRETERLCTTALQQEAMTRENRAATYVNRGIVRMRAGNYDRALSDYDSAINLIPGLAEAYLNKGAALIYQRDFAAALEPLNTSIDLGSDELHAAHYNRAIAREQTGDVAGAYEDFQTALQLKPDFELARRQLTRFTVTN